MYAAYFGLRENPFYITPDPSYLYMSPHHQEALAHLLYGTGENGGFVQLTGEVGTGKTTLIRTLLEQQLEDVDIALSLNPRLTVEEFVAAVCDELHVEYPRDSHTLKPLIDALNNHLLQTHARGRRTVLIIDEAQNLSREVLEQVRLLTNLETHRHKLLRIILVGQPELQRLLERQDMRQLAQRITARYHLTPLNRTETSAYIIHRIKVAGGRDNLFTKGALKTVHRLAYGIPRLINIICDRALMGAYSQGLHRIKAAMVRHAAREVLQGQTTRTATGSGPWWALGALLTGVTAVAVGLHLIPTVIMPASTQPTTLILSKEAASQSSHPRPPSNSQPDPQDSHVDPPPPPQSDPAVPHAATDLMRLLFATQDPNDALSRLLATWGEEDLVLPDGTPPCEHIKPHQLRCLYGHQADWSELRRYNHPVVLYLANSKGHTRQVVLRSLSGEIATLDLADRPIQADLALLDPLWTGDYLMFWRLQTSQPVIGPKSRGEQVKWLRQRLALAEGQTLPLEFLSDEFDSPLQKQVRRFQHAHNLETDGVVGVRTMPFLNNLAPAPGTPFLATPLPTNQEQ